MFVMSLEPEKITGTIMIHLNLLEIYSRRLQDLSGQKKSYSKFLVDNYNVPTKI
jgi:hypothetical protein